MDEYIVYGLLAPCLWYDNGPLRPLRSACLTHSSHVVDLFSASPWTAGWVTAKVQYGCVVASIMSPMSETTSVGPTCMSGYLGVLRRIRCELVQCFVVSSSLLRRPNAT